MGDLNKWVIDKVKVYITGAFGVLKENNIRKMIVDFCGERGLCVGTTYVMHKNLYNYTRDQDGMEMMSIIHRKLCV